MTVAERESALAAEIGAIGDVFDQYSWLVAKSAELAPLPEALRRDETLVAGCQSRVWLALLPRPDGTVSLAADGDTLILRGVLAVLAELAEGRRAAEIAAAPFDPFRGTDLKLTFTAERAAGLELISKRIQKEASALL